MDICSSPKLFAAYHVFHRPLVPRHPPCALSAWPFAFHHPSVGDAVVDSHCLINKFIDVFLSNVLRLYQGYLIKFNQIYMYAVFKVQSWLIFYQSFKKKISFLLKSLVKQPVFNSSSRLIRVSIGLIKSLLVPLCFRHSSLSNACVYL